MLAERHRQKLQIRIAPVPAAAFETQDKREQVNAQRQHPQERDRRHVLRKMIGGRQQQHRSAGRQRDPESILPRARTVLDLAASSDVRRRQRQCPTGTP